MKYRSDKGVAGLSILLSLVVMLFIIGLIVMIFSLMGSSLSDATYTIASGTVVNETLTTVTETPNNFAYYGYLGVSCSVYAVNNATDLGTTVPSANYTVDGCSIHYSGKTGTETMFNGSNWNVSYTYSYDVPNTATETINDTSSAIAGVTDWFNIFIVIGAMVVLILLTVIIITSIRGSGMIGGETSGAKSIGTA